MKVLIIAIMYILQHEVLIGPVLSLYIPRYSSIIQEFKLELFQTYDNGLTSINNRTIAETKVSIHQDIFSNRTINNAIPKTMN